MITPGISKALKDGKRDREGVIEKTSRFRRNDVFYFASLLVLFIGLFVEFGAGVALVVMGTLGVVISVATSFFVTWLSSREK